MGYGKRKHVKRITPRKWSRQFRKNNSIKMKKLLGNIVTVKRNTIVNRNRNVAIFHRNFKKEGKKSLRVKESISYRNIFDIQIVRLCWREIFLHGWNEKIVFFFFSIRFSFSQNSKIDRKGNKNDREEKERQDSGNEEV